MYGRDEHDWSWCSPPWSDVGRGLAALAVVTTILCTSMLVKTPNHPMQAWELLNEPNRTGQSPKHAQWPVVASHETIQSSTNGTWVASPPTAGFNVAVSEYWGVHDEGKRMFRYRKLSGLIDCSSFNSPGSSPVYALRNPRSQHSAIQEWLEVGFRRNLGLILQWHRSAMG